jgi:cytoskeletal protein CcmA (bactofilin family)
MFGKPKDNPTEKSPSHLQQFQHSPVVASQPPESADETSSIGPAITIVGKITGKGRVRLCGRIEGELHASTVLINEGAQVEGNIIAEDLTIGGHVKGTIHAKRVKLISSAIVEADIFHQLLSIEENAQFEGSSRREEATINAPRVPLSRPPVQTDVDTVATMEGDREQNDTLENKLHTA